MCGIFGYVSDKPIGDVRQLLDIGAFNVKRGNQAFGFLGIAEAGFIIGRVNQKFNLDYGGFEILEPCHTILFHLLSSTGTEKRIHPFETDQFIFAHNGLLIDYQDSLFNTFGPTDSQYFLSAIHHYSSIGTVEAIRASNHHFNGQRACWLWDKFDQALYLWRVMSPLYISAADGAFLFSSVKVDNSYVPLKEGSIYQIKDIQLNEVEQFNFYSPYHTGDK